MFDTFDIHLAVICAGAYIASRPSRFCKELGNWLPGEPAHIENFKVYLNDLEITKQLTEKQLSELESDYLISIESGEESA
jgi:hypothetical protein